MKKLIITLAIILYPVLALGADTRITFEWSPNTEADLAGYKMFQRQGAGAYNYATPVWQGGATTATIQGDYLDGSTYYWVLRAFDTTGNESADSNEVSLAFPVPDTTGPGAPTLTIPNWIRVGQ